MAGAFALLILAIGLEVASTAALPRTDGFREPSWSALVILGYAACTWLLALVVQRMQVSVAYAVWSGIGTASIAVVGALFLKEPLDAVKLLAIGLIVLGVVVLNLHTVR